MERVKNEQIIYSAALYCRLSKDDEQVGESVSIETQKMMLETYCEEHRFAIYEIYADDGYSGLNFNRPAFTRLLEDIDNGKINLVVTKDLSRLGRDYIQTGYYTDIYFSRKKVRYIAVNDGVDTNKDDNDIAPFKNNNRLGALSKIIKKLYEDFACDILDTDNYHKMLSDYTQEQKQLTQRLNAIQSELNKKDEFTENLQKLKDIIHMYLNIDKLTANMLNQLIERIEIGHPIKVNGSTQQEINIIYRFIGTTL